MYVDGVEFVNVISIKARIEHEQNMSIRTSQGARERADSGLGMGEAEGPETRPPVPDAISTRKQTVLEALPQIGTVY
jgi:hypothetical protein